MNFVIINDNCEGQKWVSEVGLGAYLNLRFHNFSNVEMFFYFMGCVYV